MLKKIRVALAIAFFIVISLLFLDISGVLNKYFAYFAELQFVPTLLLASLSLLIIGLLAWRNGRTYCNTFCPVGTILGYISKFSIFKLQIDKTSCTTCGRCARDCKASCIDFKNHTIDYTRCVTCFNCIESCKDGSMSYSLRKRTVEDRKSTRLNSSHVRISYAVFCLKKK